MELNISETNQKEITSFFYRILINYVDINNIKGFSYLDDLSIAFVFSIFFFSEVIFGIIPPDFFMIWGLNNQGGEMYPLFIIALSTIWLNLLIEYL